MKLYKRFLSLVENKSTKNGIYATIDVAISPVFMIIATPIFIHYLGIESYGLWVLINSVISSFAIFNFGINDIIIKFISKAALQNDNNEIKNIFSSIFVFQCLVALSILLISFFSLSILTNFEFILLYREILYIAIPIFFIKQFEQSIYAFFKSYEQYNYVALFSVFSKSFFFISQIAAAIIYQSVYYVFLFALIIGFLVFLIEIIFIKKIHLSAVFFFNAKFTTLRKLYSYGIWNWLASLISIVTVHLDKWLITAILGLEIFGYYSIGILIFNQIYNVLSSSVSWIFPKIAKNNLNLKDSKRFFYNLSYYIISITLLISLFFNGYQNIFILWLGEESFNNSRFYIESFLIMLPVFTLSTVSHYYILAVGKVKEKFIIDSITFLLKVFSLYYFLYLLNFEYWPYSFLIFLTFQALAYYILIDKRFKMYNIKKYSLIITSLLIIIFIRLIINF